MADKDKEYIVRYHRRVLGSVTVYAKDKAQAESNFNLRVFCEDWHDDSDLYFIDEIEMEDDYITEKLKEIKKMIADLKKSIEELEGKWNGKKSY